MEKVIKVPASEEVVPTTPMAVPAATPQKPDLVKSFPKKNNTMVVNIIVSLLVILAGVGTGWSISKVNASSAPEAKMDSSSAVESAAAGSVEIDDSQFGETEEGILEEGGIDGEGTHHLDRGLGEEKYVYLISSVIDLQSFVGKKVEVRGKSVAGQKAGYLMDVVKVKVLE